MNSKIHYNIYKYFSISLLIFLNLILFSHEQQIKDLELNKTVSNSVFQDDTYEYYKLDLPSNIKKGNILVFTVKESRKGIAEGDEIFSDPDIHISKKHKYPKGKGEAQWYSQRYGNDILSIPSEEVSPGETFYIGMYCEYKCRYELNAYLAEEIEIEIGKINSVTLTQKSTMSYFIKIPNEDYDEFNLVATSPNLKSFKIFMNRNTPSSQNTFKVIPSWTGGYMISVERYSGNYCIDCKYHVLIESQEESDVTVQFYAYFQDTITSVSPGSIIYDTVKNSKKRCFSYDIKNMNFYNEKLLIQTSLFSGSALLYISGNKKNNEKTLEQAMNENYSYQILGGKIIMLEKRDLDKLIEEEFYIQNDNGNSPKKLLYFCVYGKETASFILNAYSLSEASKLQKYNYISPGTELTGYLGGGQITRYRVLDFNKNKNSNITVTFTTLKGKTEYYVNFCSEKCNFNKFSLKEKINNREMLFPQETSYSTYTLQITPDMNQCYKNSVDDDKCKILLVMNCSEDESNYCSYKMLASISEKPILMSPKKTYYNIIPKGKIDYYEVVVDEIAIPSIVIVLTTVTGDAQLTVYKKKYISDQSTSEKDTKLIGMSLNKDYIPDVVRITPSKLGEDNISGRYLIKVTSDCFSSYNLYYYTTRNKAFEKKLSINDISVSLTEGQIIRDFFPNDLDYKIYIYTPDNNDKKDIKFVLTRINVGFAFKIFDDFQKIKIINNLKDDFEERIQGYLWASDENNEVTISKDDKNYSSKKSYFIVVYKNKETIKEESENNNLDRKTLMMYYIGVTKIGIPFTLYEVIEHSETLSNKYFFQNYWYIHNDLSEDFRLDINVLSGEVDVLINTKQIPIENITSQNIDISNLYESLVTRSNINNYASIELNRNYFEKYCINSKINENPNVQNNNNYYEYNRDQRACKFYIYILQSRTSLKFQRDSQYIIAAKSSSKTGKILLSGQILTGEIFPNKEEHFFIEEVKHRKGSSINVKFTEGYGELYVRIPKTIEIGKNITYPNEKNYDYKGQNAYMGQVVMLPSKVFDRIDSLSLKLQILITVVGSSYHSMNSKSVKFTISYSSEPKRINQNTPYTNYISAGEYQFYTLYFNKRTKNIYIALSNMNGDADLYLNYGLDRMPSPSEHDWYSVNMGHEYIDINENDKFFSEKKIDNLSGYYSLLVVGFTETTYTLFVSSHDDNIFPLNDNSPISCRCETKGDKCFFRYDNIFKQRGEEAKLFKSTEIIFTTQYIYGNGKIYANLLKDQDITGENTQNYQDYFPNERIYQFSNKEFGKRNYMKVKVPQEKYSKDSLILMTFICEEKTDVEVTAASLTYNGIYNYLDRDRENIFYLKYNTSENFDNQIESIFTFYSYKEDDIIYEIKAYTGMARIKVFTNETRYNSTTGKLTYDYNHISEFTLKSDNSYQYSAYKVFTENYINSIHKSLVQGKRIYFTVKPLTDFGFYLQITYDREWVNVPINRDKTYLITNNQMYGYFDIQKNFQNVEMSISFNDFTKKIAKIYIKIVVLEKDSRHINSENREDRLYHYEIPSKNNYDYSAKTNTYLGTMSININNIPIIKPEFQDTKIVRALFGIELEKIYLPINRDNDNIITNTNTETSNSKESNIRILVAPGVNNFKRVDIEPYNYYYSQTSLIQQQPIMNPYENYIYNGNKEIKIYSLDKVNEKDDKMIIQINSCSGNYLTKFSKKIVTYDDNNNDLPFETIEGLQGRKTYIIDNLRNKHVYLSIKSAQNEQECGFGNQRDRNNNICAKELSYLIYYYSTSSHKKFNDTTYPLKYRVDTRANFYLILPQINNVNEKFLEFNLIWTKDKELSKNLENICYINQIFNNEIQIDNSTVFTENNLKLNSRKEIYVKRLHLSTEPIYIHLLVRNTKNNELIGFQPIVCQINKSILKLVIFLFICLIICMPCYTYFDEIKYKLMEFYANSFNLKALFGNKSETIKYSNLSDNYY